jgi:hypothetical protein
VFGPLVVLGRGGTACGAAGGPAARLTPLTPADADQLIRERHAGPLPSGPGMLDDVLVRVSCLADDLPEVAELDLHHVIAGPGGTCAAGPRVRVTPAAAWDPLLRRLR